MNVEFETQQFLASIFKYPDTNYKELITKKCAMCKCWIDITSFSLTNKTISDQYTDVKQTIHNTMILCNICNESNNKKMRLNRLNRLIKKKLDKELCKVQKKSNIGMSLVHTIKYGSINEVKFLLDSPKNKFSRDDILAAFEVANGQGDMHITRLLFNYM